MHEHAPVGGRDDRGVALEQHGDPEVRGRAPGGVDAVVGELGDAGELPGVRGDQHRGAGGLLPELGVLAEQRHRVGVGEHRQAGVEDVAEGLRAGVVGPEAGSDDPGLHAPRLAEGVGGDDLGPGRADLVGGAARVPDHPAGGQRRGAGGEDRGAGVGPGAGGDPDDALGVLVVAGPGHRPARADVGGVEHVDGGRRELGAEPDLDQGHRAAEGRGEHVDGLAGPERHRGGGADVVLARLAGERVDAAGGVDGEDRDAGDLRGVRQRGRLGPQAPAGAGADDRVEHEVGVVDGRDAVLDVGDDVAALLPQGRQPGGVRAVRAQQHGGDGDPAPAQLVARPEPVAAVVARAGEDDDPAPGDPAGAAPELGEGDLRQAVRRPPHERALGGARKHGLLGGTHLIGRPDAVHGCLLRRYVSDLPGHSREDRSRRPTRR